MTGRMTRQSHFLNDVLKEANQHKRQQKLRYANADQINAVSELVMNKLRGAICPGRHTVTRLKPYSQQLRLIANPRQSIKRRRQLMSQQIGAGAWKELNCCYHCAKTQLLLLLDMKRVLLQRLLCLLNHFLLLAEMIKEFRQKIKERCRPKNL